jgi:RNA polymerase sigma factor for flagellar operon FliA
MRFSDAEMMDVWVEYKETGAEHLRNQLIEKYTPLVRYIAERLLATLPSYVDADDLTSMGIFGLIEAIERFDLSRGVKFKTYCMNRVRGSILDELRAIDWVPRLVRIKAGKIDKARGRLEKRFGREPSFAELAGELELNHDEYRKMIEDATPAAIISLSDEWEDGEENTGNRKIDLVEDGKGPTPLDMVHKRDIKDIVCRSLSEKEKIVVVLYYYEGLSMKEIAKVLRLTESRVCQIHSKVITRLKEQLQRIRCDLFL